MTKPTHLLVTLVLAAAALAGCSSGAATPTKTSTSASVQAPVESATSAKGAVDPNSASPEKLVAALKSSGVDNAEKWAEEIEEYGPYTAKNLAATLTRELAKYNISADQLTKLLSALQVQ